MKQGSCDPLSEAQSQFERWRRRRSRGTRIPAALWDAAAKAARKYGVSKVAGTLRLDYYKLKERLESAPEFSGPEPGDGGGFLEVPLYAAPTAECVLELEDGEGARLRVALQGVSPAELEPLARALWSLAR